MRPSWERWGDAMELSIVLEGKELGTISSVTRDRDEVGYPGLGKYFPFCAERCRLKGSCFPLSELDSGLYTFENKALRLEGDFSPVTGKMAGVVLQERLWAEPRLRDSSLRK